MTKMITKNFCFVFTMMSFSRSAIICPQHSWTEYKTVVEGPRSFVVEIYRSHRPVVNSTIRRVTECRCPNDNDVEFRTNRRGQTFRFYWVRNTNYFNLTFSETCKEECDSQNVTVQVEHRNDYHKEWQQLGNFTYVYKNCDKLYWTNWIETTNCSISHEKNYIRICAHCDSDTVDEKFCNGNPTMQDDCQPTWGAFIEDGPCVVTGCNPNVGEQIKRRECIYDDGSEATNPKLCSNQSTRVVEQCTNNTLPIECTAHTSSATDVENTCLYIGIGVALALIVIFCIVLAVVLYRLQKYRKNSTPNPINPSALVIENHVYNQIQDNTNRDGYLSLDEIATLPNNNRHFTVERPAPSNHPEQPNNEPSTSNQRTRNLTPQIAPFFLQNDQSFLLDGYEVPMTFGGQNAQMESALRSTGYVNMHKLSSLDGYEVPMQHILNMQQKST